MSEMIGGGCRMDLRRKPWTAENIADLSDLIKIKK